MSLGNAEWTGCVSAVKAAPPYTPSLTGLVSGKDFITGLLTEKLMESVHPLSPTLWQQKWPPEVKYKPTCAAARGRVWCVYWGNHKSRAGLTGLNIQRCKHHSQSSCPLVPGESPCNGNMVLHSLENFLHSGSESQLIRSVCLSQVCWWMETHCGEQICGLYI